uniref:Uncharacterized protein n=1 Tax=Schizaphis graminum TaxID=13262 RepID=A0A2S2NJR8_SCHGA
MILQTIARSHRPGLDGNRWEKITKRSDHENFGNFGILELYSKPYFRSMLNIKIIISGGDRDGDSDESRQNPDAPLEYRQSPILQLANYAGPQMPRIIAIVNAAVMAPVIEAKLPALSSSLRQYSDDDTKARRMW